MRYFVFVCALLVASIANAGLVSVAEAEKFTFRVISSINPSGDPNVQLTKIAYNITNVGEKVFILPNAFKPSPLSVDDGVVRFSTQDDGTLALSVRGSKPVDFKTFMIDHGNASIPAWYVTGVLTISTDHSAIIGFGKPINSGYYGSPFAFIATYSIPEPSTIALLSFGVVLVFLFRRSHG